MSEIRSTRSARDDQRIPASRAPTDRVPAPDRRRGGLTTAGGPLSRRISAGELRRLRNELPVEAVLVELRIESRARGRRREFRCPACGAFPATINSQANLLRCFRCGRNFNPIDLVIAHLKSGFLDAITTLEQIAAANLTAPSTPPARPSKMHRTN